MVPEYSILWMFHNIFVNIPLVEVFFSFPYYKKIVMNIYIFAHKFLEGQSDIARMVLSILELLKHTF